MNTQKLQIIKQAELSAKEIILSAEDQSHAIIREAQNKVLLLEEESKKLAREHEVTLLEKFKKNGQEKAAIILSELDREIAKINLSADKEEGKAIAFVKDQLKVSYGN